MIKEDFDGFDFNKSKAYLNGLSSIEIKEMCAYLKIEPHMRVKFMQMIENSMVTAIRNDCGIHERCLEIVHENYKELGYFTDHECIESLSKTVHKQVKVTGGIYKRMSLVAACFYLCICRKEHQLF